jgi:hypothetical protein
MDSLSALVINIRDEVRLLNSAEWRQFPSRQGILRAGDKVPEVILQLLKRLLYAIELGRDPIPFWPRRSPVIGFRREGLARGTEV